MPATQVHEIDKPINPGRETKVGYYDHLKQFCRLHFGRAPSRQTLHEWKTKGYPLQKGRIYVRVPAYYEVRTPMTTIQAVNRWLTMVRHLQKKHDLVARFI